MEVFEMDPYNPNTRDLAVIAGKLKSGATLIFPTDTNYALGCSMDNKEGIDKILRITGKREKQSKLSLICKDLKWVADFTLPYDNHTFKSMKRLTPGAFTFILNANTQVTRFFKNNKREIGIRIPDNQIVLELLDIFGSPLISTSLNLEDGFLKHFTDPLEIYESYKNDVDILIDGGYGSDEESTVLDCTGTGIELIRQGKGVID